EEPGETGGPPPVSLCDPRRGGAPRSVVAALFHRLLQREPPARRPCGRESLLAQGFAGGGHAALHLWAIDRWERRADGFTKSGRRAQQPGRSLGLALGRG